MFLYVRVALACVIVQQAVAWCRYNPALHQSNELQVFSAYANATSAAFDMKSYHDASVACMHDEVKPFACYRSLYWSRSWGFNLDGELFKGIDLPKVQRNDTLSKIPTRLRDCSYDIQESGIHEITIHSVCNTTAPNVPLGGSSFNIVSLDHKNGVLSACSVFDRLDGTYIVTCGGTDRRNQSKASHCLTVSGWLLNEHFDAYTDGRDFNSGLPPLLMPLIENFQMCNQGGLGGPHTAHTGLGTKQRKDVVVHDSSDVAGLPMISGQWVLPRNHSHHIRKGDFRLNFTDEQAQSFEFHWWQHNGRLAPMQVNVSEVRSELEDTNTLLHLYGASHIRYLFNMLEMRALGVPVVNVTTNLGNNDMHIEKEPFVMNGAYYVPLMVRYLNAFCDELQANRTMGDARSHILGLQFGSWDLTVAGFRKMLQDETLGVNFLLKFLKEIMTGTKSCGGLKKIMVLSPMPYPSCVPLSRAGREGQSHFSQLERDVTAERERKCENDRKFRSSASIEALRTVLFDGVNSLWMTYGSNSTVKFVAVDIHDVVKPMFNFDGQAVCTNHVLCCRTKKCDTTPAGEVYIDAVMHATLF